MNRLTIEQFDALRVGDQVYLHRESPGGSFGAVAVVTRRTRATVWVRPSHKYGEYEVRRNSRTSWLRNITAGDRRQLEHERYIEQISAFLYSIDRKSLSSLSPSVLAALDAARMAWRSE